MRGTESLSKCGAKRESVSAKRNVTEPHLHGVPQLGRLRERLEDRVLLADEACLRQRMWMLIQILKIYWTGKLSIVVQCTQCTMVRARTMQVSGFKFQVSSSDADGLDCLRWPRPPVQREGVAVLAMARRFSGGATMHHVLRTLAHGANVIIPRRLDFHPVGTLQL